MMNQIEVFFFTFLVLIAERLGRNCESPKPLSSVSGTKIILDRKTEIIIWYKGRMAVPKWMNFRKSSKGGGGVIFNMD